MGNLEKLVVLTVIFLSGVVLAVSLKSTGEVGADGGSPADSLARKAEAELGAGSQLAVVDGDDTVAGGSDGSDGLGVENPASGRSAAAPALLSADVDLAGDGTEGTAPADPTTFLDDGLPKGVLRRVPEITETAFADLALYTCRGTETFASLARRLYGGVEYASVIKVLNEGHDVLASGDQLLVPLDARPQPSRDRAHEARPVRPAPTTRNVAAPEPLTADDELGTTAVVHVVAEGETLSDIAARYYGKGTLWTRIYDHNRDVLENPDRVPSGIELEIP